MAPTRPSPPSILPRPTGPTGLPGGAEERAGCPLHSGQRTELPSLYPPGFSSSGTTKPKKPAAPPPPQLGLLSLPSFRSFEPQVRPRPGLTAHPHRQPEAPAKPQPLLCPWVAKTLKTGRCFRPGRPLLGVVLPPKQPHAGATLWPPCAEVSQRAAPMCTSFTDPPPTVSLYRVAWEVTTAQPGLCASQGLL